MLCVGGVLVLVLQVLREVDVSTDSIDVDDMDGDNVGECIPTSLAIVTSLQKF